MFLEVTDSKAGSSEWSCFVSHRLSVVNQKFEGDRYTNMHLAWHVPVAAYSACRGSQHVRSSKFCMLACQAGHPADIW